MRGRLRFVALLCFAWAALYPAAVRAAETNLNEAPIDSIHKVEGRKDLFRSTNFYFGGQSNLETLRWLKSEGVTTIVNLRSDKENKEFADMAFDEAAIAKELGMAYASIPLGDKASYRPQAVDTLAIVLGNHTGKAFIHCLSGGRASYVWVAYLVRHRGYSLNDAIAIGKRIKYPTNLEDLLGGKVDYTTVR
jgi:uncharacterized protein (TIGR01244 family)